MKKDNTVKEREYAYCSWCNVKIYHEIVEHNLLRRNVYQCGNCKNYTVQCRLCDNMARGKVNPENINDHNQSINEYIKNNWDNELCSEHDGSIASFDSLDMKLDELADYHKLFETDKFNWQKIGIMTGSMIGGSLIFGPIGYLAAPGIAAWLGSLGLLGSASTGAAISSLTGAALTKASLAVLGGGSLAAGGFGIQGGFVVLSAVGAALGAREGGAISNNYFGNVRDFEIKKLKGGNGPAILFINGFLSQDEDDFSVWQRGVSDKYHNNPWYGIKWESKALNDISSIIKNNVSPHALEGIAKKLLKTGASKKTAMPAMLSWASLIADLISNPWHTAFIKSAMTGVLLADILCRVKGNPRFIIMGNSLGCRVTYFLLQALSSREDQIIEDVFLLGGAVERENKEDWKDAARAVSGSIYNVHSDNDDVLRYLFSFSSLFMKKAIGLHKLECDSKNVKNIDVSSIVSGHMYYKEELANILKK